MATSKIRKFNRARLKKQRKDLREALTASATMDPDVKKAWLKALRSGEYKQGKGTLCRVDSKGTYSFCCLGVLADGALYADWHLDEELGTHRLRTSRGEASVMSDDDLEKVGLSDETQYALSDANDCGLRFSTIADAIEECL